MSRALFENMSDELRNLSREMSAIEEFKGNVKDVEEVIENINSPLTIMVMGEFSTGKSTFINALMGEAITKVDAKPTTAVITKLVYGERDRIVVHYQDGSSKEYGREEFERLTAEADAQSNELHERMDYVERTLPIDMLKSMSIIDSPGLNSIKSVHEDMTRHFMDKADTVLWMFDANKPGSQTEIDALKRLNPRLTPLVLVNKIDGIDEEEGDSVEGILEGVERRLENNKIEAQGYLGISAKMAFKGKTENRDKLVQASNIGAFYDAIEEKVLPGREQYKRNSLLDGLVKMIYGAGSQIKELRKKNEERKSSDYAAYVAMETELATVWDELENIADIMLTDIENNQSSGRKRLNAAMKSFYGMLHWLGIFVEQDDDVARKYLEEAAVRGDEAAQRVLVDWLWSKGEEEAAKYWGERIGIEDLPIKNREDVFHEKTKGNIIEDVEKGEGINKDECEAYNWHVKTMESESNEVENKIGEENGFMKMESNENSKVEKEPKEKNYKRLLSDAASGDVRAMEALGDLYCNDGEYLNFGMAIKWYKNAVKSGGERYDDGYLAGKMYLFGKKLECGDGVKKDLNEAVKWYKRAVENGLKDADFTMHAIEEMIKKDGFTVEKIIIKGSALYEKGRYAEALNCFKVAAKDGKSDAMTWMGKMYAEGKGVDQDYGEAMHWYIKAANMGNPDAMNNMGDMYNEGKGVGKDYNCARGWYQKAINAGSDKAKKKLDYLKVYKGASLYEQGKYEEALSCFKESAKEGNSDAMTWLGNLYKDGIGVGRDNCKAMSWYVKAADIGNAVAMCNIGWMYDKGLGVDQNYDQAMRWYIKASDLKNSGAMFNIGKMYEEGKGVGRDYSEAMSWYVKAADMGLPNAICNIGWMYDKGLGVDQNYDEAMKWYIKAAGMGESNAMVNIGKMYEAGNGVYQDYKNAMAWYIKAANMGNYAAMNDIGVMYHAGRGVEKNYKCASDWYKKAISAGNNVAKENLDVLEKEMLNSRDATMRRTIDKGTMLYEQGEKKKGGCFITTATCDSFGKPDNCYELNVFRNFRDNWLSCQPYGPSLIAEYYDVAPAIVRKIDSLVNSKEIYKGIWNKYLSKCLECIEKGDYLQCEMVYVDMVQGLLKRFIK